ncbi:uncharacterized protein BP01DRAFT_353938 [Aspergillus saccharolyticus JOP 1030-1]|uniref:Nucleoside phosphorylase domain-containing protein n=1 Tax=Aspergillus saccharolyticus JOP 1030-1 TaxID=1450539 RepID=A0A318ZNH0_9EURO|nr:hypothetical protein BP01DRAFT_353938 [Aspergillus saccharolyticus JOP 1030-1]PYH48064.1 hypothetical protein BP01DRAFT_353938 [Aspergillus saccharolyticus JOP 1030-1]
MPSCAHFPPVDQIRIAIICALALEADAVQAVLDESCKLPTDLYTPLPDDPNTYTLGRIGPHDIVLVELPGIGTLNATIGAGYLRRRFPQVHLALLVGICGAAPYSPDGTDIFLGDVLISPRTGREASKPASDELVRNSSQPPKAVLPAQRRSGKEQSSIILTFIALFFWRSRSVLEPRIGAPLSLPATTTRISSPHGPASIRRA